MLNGALGMSPRSAGKPKRRRLAALHNAPWFRAGARRNAACSRKGRSVECGEMSPLSMPAERENRRRPPFSRARLQDVGKGEPSRRGSCAGQRNRDPYFVPVPESPPSEPRCGNPQEDRLKAEPQTGESAFGVPPSGGRSFRNRNYLRPGHLDGLLALNLDAAAIDLGLALPVGDETPGTRSGPAALGGDAEAASPSRKMTPSLRSQ